MYQINPPPPPTLNKELLGVWYAWSRIGDREVVREAVAKGLHIQWAHTFLATRKGLELPKIQKWFKDEVFIWISELLFRRQVFKATHVLSNINLNPLDEFSRIFLETSDSDLRNYLGNHLEKQGQLEESQKQAWGLLQIISDRSQLSITEFFDTKSFCELNVQTILGKSFEWKCNVGTQLFFSTFDFALTPFITIDLAWDLLLKQDNLNLLKLWINVWYSKNVNSQPEQEELVHLFSKFEICDEMINLVVNSDIVESTKKLVLNEFSKFGVFSKLERINLKCILARIADSSCFNSLYNILNNQSSNVSVLHFQKCLIEYCVSNQLHIILNWCNINFHVHENFAKELKSKHLNLLTYLNSGDYLTDKKSIGLNILRISEYLSNSSGLESYFSNNSLIVLSLLMFLHSDIDLLQVLIQEKEIKLEGLSLTQAVINEVLKTLPFLSTLSRNSYANVTVSNITYIDLLKSHGNLKAHIFEFQLNKSGIPNFNAAALVEQYSYNKRLGYIFYLKQSRPSIASKIYLLSDTIKLKNINHVIQKLFKIVTQNFYNKEMMAGCVAFLEMIGQDSNSIRVHVKVARILHKSGKFSVDEIKFFLENRTSNPMTFLDALESVLLNTSFISGYSGFDLIEEIKRHDIAVRFSRIHDLKLPILFLKHCSERNLWLPFLIFIQSYNYPLEQVQKLLCNFHDHNLIDHLYHGLSNDINVDDQKNLLMRDSRKYYLSRIGVRKSVDNTSTLDGMHSSMSSFGSYASTGSSTSSDIFENDNIECNAYLLQTLIRCHNSIDPPKALLQSCYVYRSPIFSVLATSYEPDSIVSNWLTWLSVSCEIDDKFSNFETATITANMIRKLLKSAIRKSRIKTLRESFQIFLEDNPLKIFVDILNNCVDLNFDFDLLSEKLSQFENELKHKRNNSIVSMDVDYEMMYLKNRSWLEKTAIELFSTCLQHNFSSQYNQLRFLKFLGEVEFHKYFSIQIPDLQKFVNIIDYLLQSKCDIKLDLSVIHDEEVMKNNLLKCVEELVLNKFYDCAFEVAKIAAFPLDFVLLNKWQDKFENRHHLDFWDRCDYSFKTSGVQPNAAVKFLVKCCEKTDDKSEKYHILNLAHKWATFHNLPNLYQIEMKVWLAYFDVDTKIGDAEFLRMNPRKILYGEMQQTLKSIPTVCSQSENSNHIDKAIERLLDHNDIWQSLRLAKIFGHRNSDLELIVLCCKLAEGFLMPYQLTTEHRLLLNKTSNLRSFGNRRRRTLLSSKGLSSFSSVSHSFITSTAATTDHVETPFQDTLAILETLNERIKHGEEIVQNIHLAYRISVNVETNYKEIFLCENPMHLLKQALDEDCSNKLEVVHDFCLLFKWSKEEISDLLCEALITCIGLHLKSKQEPIVLWDANLDADFHLILQLLPENCSTLGLKLYKYANVLHKSQTQSNIDFKISEINLVIELLICSHNCFTADCNMEGISTILRKCQSMVALLLTLKSWKLIVRLLTGIARYSEMNYVFHILKENYQFEFLLRKGSRKDNGLKVALLKYLKKYCPEDRELYRMVALHFTLFSEIAQLWEEEARSIVRNLIAISKLEMQNNGFNVETQPYVLLTNTDGTKICLNKAMVNYTHATEYHLQGEKLSKAMAAAKQAELLALQISLLKGLPNNSTMICLLNATDAQFASLMCFELSFAQSLILVEAYNFKADWTNVLFQQFVVSNHTNYLENYLGSFSLTDSLVYEISRKFISLKAISDATIKNMKDILNKCTSVHVKYRVASELGFSDLVEELLIGDELSYLKDTVWKKGYKS